MGTFRDLTGQRFGKLVVQHRANNSNRGVTWLCKCDCGNEHVVKGSNLTYGSIKSCGCSKTGPNLAGKRFGRLLVLDEYEVRRLNNGHTKGFWKCRCDCGNEKFIAAYSLTSGYTISCGCYHSEVSHKVCVDRKTPNNYDLTSKKYGIGYCSDGTEFYFDKEDFDKIKDFHWYHDTSNDYIVTANNSSDKHATILMHTIILQVPKNMRVNHIHIESKHDNRKSNLRVANTSQIMFNQPVRSNNTSGITGVYYNKSSHKWSAQLTHYGAMERKSFKTKEEAIAQRKAWEEMYFGEYSYDNSQTTNIN